MACRPVYDFINGSKLPAPADPCPFNHTPAPRPFQFELLHPSAAAIELLRRHEQMLIALAHRRSESDMAD